MKSRPIFFSTEMVQAILAGRKTQTRRIVKYSKQIQSPEIGFSAFTNKGEFEVRGIHESGDYGSSFFNMPYQKDDVLYVRETWNCCPHEQVMPSEKAGSIPWYGNPDHWSVVYRADSMEEESPEYGLKIWKPSIHMPKEAARLFLKITDIRVERLQDISEADAVAEGIEMVGGFDSGNGLSGRHLYKNYLPQGYVEVLPIDSFQSLWDSIYADRAPWDSNPWVWVITFERCERPENFNPAIL